MKNKKAPELRTSGKECAPAQAGGKNDAQTWRKNDTQTWMDIRKKINQHSIHWDIQNGCLQIHIASDGKLS